MSEYKRRDVLKTSTGAVLIAGGSAVGSGTVTGAETDSDFLSLPETGQPEGWTSYQGNSKNASYIENGHEFDGNALETVWVNDQSYTRPTFKNSQIATTDATVYTGYSAGNAEGVAALNADDGSIKWKNETVAGTDPAVDDESVFVRKPYGIVALDRSDGQISWEVTFDENQGPSEDNFLWWTPKYGKASVPNVAYGAVYTTVNGSLYALETDDGTVRWQIEHATEDRIFDTTPAAANGLVYASAVGELLALDPTTGEIQWKLDEDFQAEDSLSRSVESVAVSSATFALDRRVDPVVGLYDIETQEVITRGIDGDRVAHGENVSIIRHYKGGLTAIDIESGEKLWRNSNVTAQPIIVGDTVYTYENEEIIALSKHDGTKQWTYTPALPDDDSRDFLDLVVSGDMMYLVGDGVVAMRDMSDTTGSESGGTGNDGADGAGDGTESGGADTGDGTESESSDTRNGTESDDFESETPAVDDSNATETNESTGGTSDSKADSSGSDDETEKTPGFGVVGGLAGTVGGAVLAARRLVSSDDLPE
ncbi:PQQ-binding-like beta-propeller repeat protein [Natrinema halophilum]|uniref:PQQ-binding-like beta-propeller repeat protein n=1 Tax=Natrinema halophilum TaxID=1699371 RepID=A0A7D5KT11_9EURY|nr:PQQ-binding-like beta-propeller repeat protein [Natrinema halophilum]QLG50957.1 PQQ-binding-like beta-propeller repeat protein [Natrinema halophilum]